MSFDQHYKYMMVQDKRAIEFWTQVKQSYYRATVLTTQ